MGTYTSKYTGEEIDNLLGQVENGGGSSSGYSETELLNEVARYTLPKSSSTTNIAQDLVLNDDITNYDQIVFNVARYETSASGCVHNTNIIYLSSTIVFNNSNTQVYDEGSRITLEISSGQEQLCCSMWFKDAKTIRINKLFTGNGSDYDVAEQYQFTSIKGIKY